MHEEYQSSSNQQSEKPDAQSPDALPIEKYNKIAI